jgi:hypothetical protein
MVRNFIEELIDAVNRVLTLDTALLKEVLIVCGMPEKTQNLRYLNFNRQLVAQENRTLEFSAVAVINNRRTANWALSGYRRKISQVVFSTRWTRNPLDLFLNNLRCSEALMEMLGSSSAGYTLLGILHIREVQGTGILKRKLHFIRPVVAVPRLNESELEKIKAFEAANEIQKTRILGLLFYRKIGLHMPAS